jgi:hypothetical protein
VRLNKRNASVRSLNPGFLIAAMSTSSGRVSEERSIARWDLAAERKLIEEVNMAVIAY